MAKRRFTSSPIFIITVCALILMLPQLFNHNVVVGVDGMFHMNRFYDAMQQIRHANFSYMQMNYGFEQSGRVVTALYGPLFTYVAGFLLLITHSWLRFQLVIGFLLELIAGIGMLKLSEKIGAHRPWIVIASLIYMVSGIVPAWLSSSQFSSWGAALVPFVLMSGVAMAKKERVAVLPLAVSMALLVQTHMLSAVLAALALIPLAIYGMWQNKHWQTMLVRIAAAAALCLLLTMNVWGAMLNVYGHNQLVSPFGPIASSTNSSMISYAEYGVGTTAAMGLILSGLFLAQICFVLFSKERSRLNLIVTLDGAFFLLLSSNLLPWTKIIAHWPALVSYLQFPSRFRVISGALLIAGAALSVSELNREATARTAWRVVPAVAIAMLGWQTLGASMTLGDTWQSPSVIPDPTGVMFRAKNMKQIKNALASNNPGDAIQAIGKASADYLPLPDKYAARVHKETAYNVYQTLSTPINPLKGKTMGGGMNTDKMQQKLAKATSKSTDSLYRQQILIPDNKVQKTVLRHGILQLTWTGNKAKWVQIPAVAYQATRATLNGKQVSQSSLMGHRSKIGVISVQQRRGNNTLTMAYHTGFMLRLGLTITWLSWILAIVLMVLRRLFQRQRRTGAHSQLNS
ncbi:hypothetical protein PQ472_10855 [Lacticaseibacillus pabuli]|uniref:Membrane protein YfhO n=1 Tax=Lacticaseibacillus pabuli TaxID=3025672 RepID=A0ABY7WWR7_9LACO|nr:hypothetical protein [Lacticaseibacillus sp. KACC 23028]WDF82375.1 hypothetical protein PQ472_10855 [Lacticaseibacillus sp. KACC 23028]